MLGRRIVGAYVIDPRLVAYPLARLEMGLQGQRIVGVDRRAKYLLLRLSSGKSWWCSSHRQLLLVNPRAAQQIPSRLLLIWTTASSFG